MTNKIPAILKGRRKELGLTQIEVAMESGIELQQYQRFEKGIRPFETCSFKIGLRVCAALKLDPYALLFIHHPQSGV